MNQRGKFESPRTVLQPSRCSESGMIVGGNWLICAFDMNELRIIQISGSAKSTRDRRNRHQVPGAERAAARAHAFLARTRL